MVTQEKEKTGPAKEVFRGDVALDKIRIETNFRKSMDPARLKELTESILRDGVLEPVLLRPGAGKGSYVLIAGHRRYRAAEAAGLKEIPVRVLDVTEQQAAEIQALENLHREDVNPIDEARSFKVLMEKYGHKAEELADRVSKSASYVHRLVRLLDLPEKVVSAIEDERITAAHGTVIARLQVPADQLEMLQSITAQKLSAKAAENALAKRGRDLAGACFDKGECVKCPYNGKRQQDLFDKDTDLDGRCMNPPCFDKKVKEAKSGPTKKKTATKNATSSSPRTAQGGLDKIIETIVEHVRKDSNLGYMRILADGILRGSSDRVQFEFMRRREPSIRKNDVAKAIQKYLEKLTDFFIPGFCVELTILGENPVKEGELVHQFTKLYGIRAGGAAASADKSVQAGLKALGTQIAKDEKPASVGKKK